MVIHSRGDGKSSYFLFSSLAFSHSHGYYLFMSTIPPEFMTVEQAADVIGVNKTAVRRYIRNGLLDSIGQAAKYYLIPRAAVDGFVRPRMGPKPGVKRKKKKKRK